MQQKGMDLLKPMAAACPLHLFDAAWENRGI
jgi:hypothetical protein